ncbi:methyltransferase domain-containing protein [Methanoculleus sediminis]|uniref:methyltransferase domain-containing protein n=1 Tax=Methanoculleus sediminis TaxID=1550566 RepID=UPI00069BDB4B|nr:class I SAM-dependent methyltransferase [Methanoculleus sediminis]
MVVRPLILRPLSFMLHMTTVLRRTAVDLLQSREFGRTLLYDIENRGTFEDVSCHEMMIADTVRMKRYYDAINRHINPDDIVVDLGTGTGVLSFFAAQKNPKKIYAVDHSEFMIAVAQKIADGNGINNVVFLPQNSRFFEPDEKVDVILHEQMGSNLVDENMIENILDLKKRILKNTGRILPGKFELFLEPICLKEEYRIPHLWENNIYGIDFNCLRDCSEYNDHSRPPKLKIEHSSVDYLLCEPEPILSFDLNTMHDPGEIPKSIEISKKVVRSGSMDGLCLYFRVIFDDEINFDTSPLSPRTHWDHPFFRTARKRYAQGETISFKFTMDVPTRRETWSISVE